MCFSKTWGGESRPTGGELNGQGWADILGPLLPHQLPPFLASLHHQQCSWVGLGGRLRKVALMP